jgi:hypothetical protein
MNRFLLSLLLCGGLGAGEIQQYATRVDLAADGSATATADLAVSGAAGETVEIPVGFKASGFLLKSGPPGLRLEAGAAGVKAVLPVAGVSSFSFTFKAAGVLVPEKVAEGRKPTMPASSRVLRHLFVNTKESPIKDYTLVAALPAGYRFQTVKEKLPKMSETEVDPRVLLGRADGRQNVRLHKADLKQGDSTSMTLEAIPSRRSPLWLAAGLLAALLYLIFYRELVAKKA